MQTGFLIQILMGMVITLQLAGCALLLGLGVGLLGALLESIPYRWLRYTLCGAIFVIRGLPELLVLFFIYFGLTQILSQVFHQFIDISAFAAGVLALGLIFGAYASQVFVGAFQAIDKGQLEAGRALGLSGGQIFWLIELPQAWRHAIPGLGNLWLVLLKDTAIVSLIGLADMMYQAKMAASTTNQPFTYYFVAAVIYLVITTVSQWLINQLTRQTNRYI